MQQTKAAEVEQKGAYKKIAKKELKKRKLIKVAEDKEAEVQNVFLYNI